MNKYIKEACMEAGIEDEFNRTISLTKSMKR